MVKEHGVPCCLSSTKRKAVITDDGTSGGGPTLTSKQRAIVLMKNFIQMFTLPRQSVSGHCSNNFATVPSSMLP